MRGLLLLFALAAVVSKAGVAQAPDVQPGTKIRVSFDCHDPASGGGGNSVCQAQRGVLVQLDSEGLIWKTNPTSAAERRAWSTIRSVEVSRGRRGHAGTGAAVGAVVGAIPGALSGMAYASAMSEGSHPNYAPAALIGGLIFAGPGALAGAIVGQLVRTERWQDVAAQQLRVSVMPIAWGRGIGVSVRF